MRAFTLLCSVSLLALTADVDCRQDAVATAPSRPPLRSTLPDASDDEWVYTVRRGDNLWSLARDFLADRRYLEQVRLRNRVADVLALRPGTRLRIPFAWLKAQPVAATLADASGDVRVVRAGDQVAFAAPTGTSLHRGDAVVTGTGGSATVEFADGSRLGIGAGSRIALDTLSEFGPAGMVDTTVRLERGRAWSRVNSGGGRRGRYRLVTPAAAAVARGTEFRVEADPDAGTTDAETLEGMVRAEGSAAHVDISSGFGTRVKAGEPPAAPVPLLPPPVFGGPLTVTRLPVRVALPTVEGAAAYRAEVGTDASFSTFAVEATTQTPLLRGLDLADGQYQLRTRGIDALGLEGRDAVTTLVVDARPEPPVQIAPAAGATVAEPRPVFRWTQAAGASAYRVQVSTGDRLDAPFVDTVVSTPALTPDPVLPPGRYVWRVATRTGDEEGPFSDPSPFDRRERPVAPTASADTRAGQLVLRWTTAVSPARYRYQVARDGAFSSIVAEDTVTTSEARLAGLAPGSYFLRIKSIEADGFEGDFGTVQSFEMPEPPKPRRLWPYIVAPAVAGALLLLLL